MGLKMRLLGLLVLILHAGPWCGWAIAQLPEPRPITPEGASAVEARLGVDPLDNAFLAVVQDGKVRVRVEGSAISGDSLLSDIDIPQADPWVEVGPRGQAWVVFTQEDNELGARGREILLSTNPGGLFREPLNVSRNRVDDHSPRLALDPGGVPRLVWVRQEGDETVIVHYEHRSGSVTEAARGEHPFLAVDGAGVSRIAFVRGDAVLLVSQVGTGFGPEVEMDRFASGQEVSPRLGVDGAGRLAAAWVAAGELRLSVRAGDAPAALRSIDAGIEPGSAAALDLHLSDGGMLALAYIRAGDVHLARGELVEALAPERITSTPDVESSPAVREDSRGSLHLGFIRGGRVFYANEAPPPLADFTAARTDGELPLDVEFEDLSTGLVRVWRWNFGDGTTSSERSPRHTYQKTGRYTVKLEVFGPGGESRMERTGYVIVREPSYTFRLPETLVLPGQSGVWVPVLGFHRQACQGFQVAGRFDPRVLKVKDLSLEATATSFYAPEFFAPAVSEEEGWFTAGVILDYSPPYDGREMVPGLERRLLHLVMDVRPEAQPGETRVELGDDVGPSGLSCMFAVKGLSWVPVLRAGKVTVLPLTPPLPRLFLRGDDDANGEVNLTDAVGLLDHLFQGSALIACVDAADSNDSGEVDVSDVIYLLVFLFQSGPPLAPPYPAPGLDPTADGLPACTE